MAIGLMIVGGAFLLAAFTNHITDLFSALREDIFGAVGFIKLAALIVVIWVGSAFLRMPNAGHALAILIILVYVLRNNEALQDIQQQVESARPQSTDRVSVGEATTVQGPTAENVPAGSGGQTGSGGQGASGGQAGSGGQGGIGGLLGGLGQQLFGGGQ